MNSCKTVFLFSVAFALTSSAVGAPTMETQRNRAAGDFQAILKTKITTPRKKPMSNDIEAIRDVRTFYAALEGEWRGRYHLWLYPGAPDESSDSSARIAPKGGAWAMNYEWAKGEQAHNGEFEFSGSDGEGGFRWTDTFHSADAPMRGAGTISADGRKLTFISTYSAGEGRPEWSWRTEISWVDENTFLMEAYNITPEGQEALAVQCRYAKK